MLDFKFFFECRCFLSNNNPILPNIYSRNIIRLAQSANMQALPLANSKIIIAIVMPNNLAISINNFSFLISLII